MTKIISLSLVFFAALPLVAENKGLGIFVPAKTQSFAFPFLTHFHEKKKIKSSKKKEKNTYNLQKKSESKKNKRKICQQICLGASNVGVREACEYQCQNPGEPVLVRGKSSGGDDGFSFLSNFTNI